MTALQVAVRVQYTSISCIFHVHAQAQVLPAVAVVKVAEALTALLLQVHREDGVVQVFLVAQAV